MAKLAVIGGTGADLFPNPAEVEAVQVEVEWGEISAPVKRWYLYGHEMLFLARHGEAGKIPPHQVNYRANMQALKDLGADWVISINAVGAIAAHAGPGQLVFPNQLIDYSWGREHTYYDGQSEGIDFIDFTIPYDQHLREKLINGAADRGLQLLDGAIYGVTQGPRLESAAEIDRLERDGCHIVGMTGMPEAGLARELGLPYASCCIVVNWAAGRSTAGIHDEIAAFLQAGMTQAAEVVDAVAASL
jgi:5'-methylthioinosine phosphorylase